MGALNADWRGRRALVTGATGIVGSWLCEELLARGAIVVAFVLDDDPQSRLYSEGIARRCSVVRGHLARFEDCLRAINLHECQDVFHLGAQTIVSNALREPLETFESNVRGTYNLLEAARRLAPLVETFVVASSDKAYGESPVLPYTEDMPLIGRHPYDVSKSCTDLLATTYAHTYGLATTIARCGNIYGGGDLNWSRIVPGAMRSVVTGEPLVLRSDGGPKRDYIYVRDVVDAYLALSLATRSKRVPYGEAFNFSPERAYTVLEVVAEVASATGVAIEPQILATATMEIQNQALDSSKARARLGWSANWSMADGLAQTAAWYRSHLESKEDR